MEKLRERKVEGEKVYGKGKLKERKLKKISE
jgi:hypothetical protein